MLSTCLSFMPSAADNTDGISSNVTNIPIFIERISIVSPLVLCMALCAHFADLRKIDHVLILCAVRPVAAQTLHMQVLVSRVPDLLSDRMGRMLLPVMACAAHIYHRRLVQNESA